MHGYGSRSKAGNRRKEEMMNERLKRLERENRILKWAGVPLLMLIVIATLALFGPGRYQVIVVGDPYVDCEPIGKQVVYSVERR